MFSHDGSVAPLREYLKLLPARALLLVDDAHGVGVLGSTGKGSLEYADVKRQRVVQCITLSKAFGVYGGAVLTSGDLREKIVTTSRAFAGTTPLPPPLAGAAITAIKIIQAEPSRRKKLRDNTAHLRERLRVGGWDLPEFPGPIVRLPSLDDRRADKLKNQLLAANIYPPFLKYGKASAGGFFRFVISSEHTRVQLDNLARVLISFRANEMTNRES
jgi:7-keto-8-aminopelargonate synthetase-like enzyme